MDNTPHFIFIGGCGRSGTTMIQNVLTNHSKINGGPEFGFTHSIFSMYRNMKKNFEEEFFKYIDSEDQLKKKYIDFYSSFFNNFNKNKVLYISEKTPNNIDVAKEVLDVFPTSKFVYVYRDSRDVVNSHLHVKKRYKKQNRFADFNIKSVCRLWNRSNDQFRTIQAAYGKDRVIAIQYEAFVTNPPKEIKRLLLFLKIEYEEIDSTSSQKSEKEKAYVNDIWYTKEMLNQKINTNNIGKWKSELGFFKKINVTARTASNLNHMDYKVRPIYLKLNKFWNQFSKESLRKTSIYKFYRKIRLQLS